MSTNSVRMALRAIREEYANCAQCPELYKERVTIPRELGLQEGEVVFGSGNVDGRLMFIGEGPGANEASEGEPFVGDAGEILDMLCSQVGLNRRSEAYTTNVVMCRAVNREERSNEECERLADAYGKPKESWKWKVTNRQPDGTEVKNCYDRLCREIYSIDPYLIITLGAEAAKCVLHRPSFTVLNNHGGQTTAPIKGHFTAVFYPVVPLIHPSYLMQYTNLWSTSPDNLTYQSAKELKRAIRVYDEMRYAVNGIPIPDRTAKARILTEEWMSAFGRKWEKKSAQDR